MAITAPGTCILALLVAAIPALAQDRDLEKYRFELTAGVWLAGVTGRVETNGVSADFDSDLRMAEKEPRFFGKLAVKPGRRHRLFVEGFTYRRKARFVAGRDFSLGGRTVPAAGRSIDARTDADYVLGGYQFDVVSRARGHLGILVGAGRARGEAEAALSDVVPLFQPQAAFTSGSAPIGAVGVEGRGYIREWLSVAGEVKGLGLGSRGHLVSAGGNLGVGLGCCVIAQAGYALLDVRARSGGGGALEPRLAGPIFSIVLLDRGR